MKAVWTVRVSLLIVFTLSLGCAAGPSKNLGRTEVDNILAKEGVLNVSSVEQQLQDDETVVLLVTGNLHDTTFSGCLADRMDIELTRSGKKWVATGKSTSVEVSFVPCGIAAETGFALVEGGMTDQFDQSVHFLRQLIAGAVPPNLVSFKSPELRASVSRLDLREISWVFFRENGDIEFQFTSDAVMPRLLSVRMSISHGQLNEVHINADDSIEIVEPQE